MQVWVDADACPVPIKEVLFRAAQRLKLVTTLVANQYLRTPNSPYIKAIQVPGGFDVADDYIEEQVAAGDLVITQDIPLAAKVVEQGAIALSPRGVLFDTESVRGHLARRNFMEEMRGAGMVSGGPDPLNNQDITQFANQLDRLLARMVP
ncbi:MAG: YaiI/YqxD family protein [Pseudomonadales bacterium]